MKHIINTGHIFTPRPAAWPDADRIIMRISDEDNAKIGRGPEWLGKVVKVTDLNTGTLHAIKGADCGSEGCVCDAEIVDVIPRYPTISIDGSLTEGTFARRFRKRRYEND